MSLRKPLDSLLPLMRCQRRRAPDTAVEAGDEAVPDRVGPIDRARVIFRAGAVAFAAR
jgi:hypothetical protein